RGETAGGLGARAARRARQRAGCCPSVRRARDLRAGEGERRLQVGASARARGSGTADARDRRVGRRRVVRTRAREPGPRAARRPPRAHAPRRSDGRGRLLGEGARMSYRVAMDIGGTFTDFVVHDGMNGGAVSSGKVLTTPANPAEGVLEGLRQFVAEPEALQVLVHGTTGGLNALLEPEGPPPPLLMTARP